MFDFDKAQVVHTQNMGDLVICDFCNSDGKYSTGGVMIGSSAVCGKCCEKITTTTQNMKMLMKLT